ncbi:MAG: hypothetical protein ACFE85_13950 [Candidatus Hodarchaeota archaeon]
MSKKLDERTYLSYLLQSLNVDGLKQICRDFEIGGFSKLKKLELIDFILDSLAEEEYKELLKQKELDIISSEINLAIKKIRGEDRETIENVKLINEEEHEIELTFKGFNWEIKSYLSITSKNINNPERDCDCRIGSNMGFCNHFWVGFIISLKEGYFNLSDWKLTILPPDFKNTIETIQISFSPSKGDDQSISIYDESAEDFELQKYIDNSITVYEGEITNIEEKQQVFQDITTTYFLITLKNVRFGPRIEKKSDFREEDIESTEILYLRISDKLYNENDLKIGKKVSVNGKLTKDNFLKLFIVKNIRKISFIK